MKDKRDMHTLDLFGGETLKQQGMQQALDNERAEWKAQYVHFAEQWFAAQPQGTEFQGEDVRAYVQRRIGAPHHPNVWGGVFGGRITEWFKQHRLDILPRMRPAKATRSHGHVYRVYRKR